MALDPTELVRAVADSAHGPLGPPPALLRHPVRSPSPTTPLRDGETISAVHRAWAAFSAGHGPDEDPDPGGQVGSTERIVRRARVLTRRIAHKLGAPAPSDQSALFARMVQALDAVAARCDELAGRLDGLETALEEIVQATSEDLVQIRAAVNSTQGRTASESDG